MATGGKTQESSSSLERPKELLKYSFDYLKQITNDFSDEQKICGDLLGTVYKGTMEDGKVISVEKLEQNALSPPEKPFKNEVPNIMKLKHKNIAELVGFCNESLFCYEYVPNGSLQQKLFGTKTAEDSSSAEHIIDWDTRFKIVKGICQGLHFLHKLDPPIVHMDIKLENIWLDETMVPKIANVGLSSLFDPKHTSGYMAPEYEYNGKIPDRIDIYCLGVMIIQITTGEENCRNERDRASRGYIDQIRRDWTAEHIASKYLSLDSECLHQVHACIKTGLECVQIDQRNRPSIEEIVDRLNTI